jgi:hypothetical protein
LWVSRRWDRQKHNIDERRSKQQQTPGVQMIKGSYIFIYYQNNVLLLIYLALSLTVNYLYGSL